MKTKIYEVKGVDLTHTDLLYEHCSRKEYAESALIIPFLVFD